MGGLIGVRLQRWLLGQLTQHRIPTAQTWTGFQDNRCSRLTMPYHLQLWECTCTSIYSTSPASIAHGHTHTVQYNTIHIIYRPVARRGLRGSIQHPKWTHQYHVTTIHARHVAASHGRDPKEKPWCIEAKPYWQCSAKHEVAIADH